MEPVKNTRELQKGRRGGGGGGGRGGGGRSGAGRGSILVRLS